MYRLDRAFLEEVGLWPLRADLANLALATVKEMLDVAVGKDLVKRMSPHDLDVFEYYHHRGDDPGALRSLERAIPDYRDTVAANFERLRSEIAASAAEILLEIQQAVGEIETGSDQTLNVVASE
jgi:hypothetical protein